MFPLAGIQSFPCPLFTNHNGVGLNNFRDQYYMKMSMLSGFPTVRGHGSRATPASVSVG